MGVKGLELEKGMGKCKFTMSKDKSVSFPSSNTSAELQHLFTFYIYNAMARSLIQTAR